MDYYAILGVPRDADPERIRAAYRRAARRDHPDATGGDPAAEARFKRVCEAYDVLSDAHRRLRYDRDSAGAHPGDAWTEPPRTGPAGFEEVFGGFRSGVCGRGGSAAFEEVPSGWGRSGLRPGAPRRVRGRDRELEMDLDLVGVARGGSRRVQFSRLAPCVACGASGEARGVGCGDCAGQGRALRPESMEVPFPAGARPGARLVVAGMGDFGPLGGPPGDLFVVVRVHPHPWFRTEDRDVFLSLPLTPHEATAGCRLRVPTLYGPTTASVPAGVRPGQRLRLKERGLPDPDGGPPGHQYLEVELVLPEDPSEEARELLRRFDALTGHTPRRGLWDL